MMTKIFGTGMLALVVGIAFAPAVAAEPTCPPGPGQSATDTAGACLALAISTLQGLIADVGQEVAEAIEDLIEALQGIGETGDGAITDAEIAVQGVVALLASVPGTVAALLVEALDFAAEAIAFAGCLAVGPTPCTEPVFGDG